MRPRSDAIGLRPPGREVEGPPFCVGPIFCPLKSWRGSPKGFLCLFSLGVGAMALPGGIWRLPWEQPGLVGLVLGSAPAEDWVSHLSLGALQGPGGLPIEPPPAPREAAPAEVEEPTGDVCASTRTAHVRRRKRRRVQGARRSRDENKRVRVLDQLVDRAGIANDGGTPRGRQRRA